MITIANILPFGYNVGNKAISFSIRNLLYNTFGRYVSVIEYPACSHHESTTKAGLSSSTIHELNRFADGVIVGGGNLYENNEITVDENALSSLLPPLFLFSNSKGRIYNRFNQLSERSDTIPDSKLKSLLQKADISASRDSATLTYTENLGLSDQLGYCPTINLNKFSSLLPSVPESEDPGCFISIRTPSLMNIPFINQSQIIENIHYIIDKLQKANFKRIRILCNDSRDLDFGTIFKYSCGVDTCFTSDVYQYLSLIKNAEFIVSYRLHATLPAISFDTKVMNLVYDERASSLSDDLGIQNSTLNIVDCSSEFNSNFDKLLPKIIYSDQTQIPEKWEEIKMIQQSLFQEFKHLVENYIHR